MSKQDRQGVRTASELERKYDLGAVTRLEVSGANMQEQLGKLNQTFSQFMGRTNEKFAEYDYFKSQATQDIESLEEDMSKVALTVYPVGAIYTSVKDTDPSTLFGGTWEAVGSGHIILGQDTDGDTPQYLQTLPTCYIWQRTK